MDTKICELLKCNRIHHPKADAGGLCSKTLRRQRVDAIRNEFRNYLDSTSSIFVKKQRLDASASTLLQCWKKVHSISDVSRTIFIPVYQHGHPNSGTQITKYTFICTIILYRRLCFFLLNLSKIYFSVRIIRGWVWGRGVSETNKRNLGK